jgi:hypothetical protein
MNKKTIVAAIPVLLLAACQSPQSTGVTNGVSGSCSVTGSSSYEITFNNTGQEAATVTGWETMLVNQAGATTGFDDQPGTGTVNGQNMSRANLNITVPAGGSVREDVSPGGGLPAGTQSCQVTSEDVNQ